MVSLICIGRKGIATSPGGAAAPEFNLSLEVRFEVTGVEVEVVGSGVLGPKGSTPSESTVDGVRR